VPVSIALPWPDFLIGKRSITLTPRYPILGCLPILHRRRICYLARVTDCAGYTCFADVSSSSFHFVTVLVGGKLLYPPSERSETSGYSVFTFVCLSVCLCALSPVFNSVCQSHNASAISKLAPDCMDMHGPFYSRSIGSLWTQELQYL